MRVMPLLSVWHALLRSTKMSDRSPGDALHPEQVPGIQEALPTPGFLIQSHVMNVGGGSYAMNTPVLLPVPLVHANYQSSDVPFQKLSTDYKS